MKKTSKLIGIITIAAVIGLTITACGDGSGGGNISVTFNSVTADGSSSQTTTQLTLIFSQAISGLTENDISLNGVSGVNKGILSGSGPAYTLPISDFTQNGTLTVSVSKSSYDISPPSRTATIYYYSGGDNILVSFDSVTADGSPTSTTTQLTLTFSQVISGLTENDISLSGMSGVNMGILSSSGPVYTLPISGFTQNGTLSISVSKSGYDISPSSRTATIYYYYSGGTLSLNGNVSISPNNNLTINVELTADYSGSEAVGYQWYKDDTAIPDATSNKYTPTEAGSYTVTVSAAGYNSKTSTAVTVINPETPVADDYDISGASTYTYDGSPKSVTISPKTDKSQGNITVYYNGVETVPTDAGTYTITFNVAAVYGWNAATGLSAGTLIINKAAGASLSKPAAASKAYNRITINAITASTGQSVEYAISTASDETGLSAWQSGTVFTGLNINTTYYIYVRSVGNDNYETTTNVSDAITTLQSGTAEITAYYWVNEQDVLATTDSTDEGSITLSPGQELIITAQSAGYTNQQWHLNGVNTGRTGTTYTFSSTITGNYTVGLFVQKGGKYYNANFAITVEE
jgi:hypothetical protein